MKRAYVKVKTPGTKTILKRPYIAATIIGAAVCAIVLSVSFPQGNENQIEEQSSISVPSAVPQVTNAPPERLPKEPIQTPNEVEMPAKQEVTPPQETELSTVAVEEESISAGMFTMEAPSFILPVAGELLHPYSDQKPVKSKTMGDWRIHTGIDIRAERGAEIKAPADGKIVLSKANGLTGNTISIDHGNGIISTIYSLENLDKVPEGKMVKQGEVIGTVGANAPVEMSEDAHLHFEVKKGDKWCNPQEFLK